MLRLLLDAGARVDEATAHKPRPLESALRFRQLDAARALLAAGASVAPEDRPWVEQLLGNAETPSGMPPPAATASPALRGLFNTRGPQAGGMPLGSGLGSNSSALEALAAAQARMHTAQAGVMNYQWRPAPQSLRAELASEPTLAAAGLRVDGARSRIDVTGLAWYDEALLLRVQDPDWPNPALTAWFVRSADGALVRLLGRSTPLHDLADSEPLRLGPANVLGYLKFFCFFVRGEEGAFYVLEHADDPLIPAGIDPRLRVLLEETVRPASYEGRDEAGRHLCEAVVWYSNALFHARFALDDGGGIEMLSDEPVAGELPIRADAPLS